MDFDVKQLKLYKLSEVKDEVEHFTSLRAA